MAVAKKTQKNQKKQQRFNVDDVEDFDDGTRAVTYDDDEDQNEEFQSDGDDDMDENARLTSSRKQRMQQTKASKSNKEKASSLRVKNWNVDMMESEEYAGKVVKRKDVVEEEEDVKEDEADGFSSPDEDAMEEWSEAEPFGESEPSDDEEQDDNSDDADEDDELDGDKDAEKLIHKFEREDSAQLMSKKDSAKIMEKAQHIRHQKITWERCLEVQIYTKRLLTTTKAMTETETPQDEKEKLIAQLYECIDAVSTVQDKLCNVTELSPLKESKKRKRLSNNQHEELWSSMVESNQHMLPQYNEILNTYTRKTNLSAGNQAAAAKKFKAVNQDILSQVEAVLADTQRVKRKAHAPLDQQPTEEEAEEEVLDELMYDDADFYQQLLKEFIESGSGPGGVHDVLAQRASHKKKKKVVNRKASKGRQIRYVVHPKLENFMFPDPYPASGMDVDELYRSLFGGQRQA